ncbi:MAG: hypothetical protein ACRD9L_11035, partial [Bryobacteraceae bacterium]
GLNIEALAEDIFIGRRAAKCLQLWTHFMDKGREEQIFQWIELCDESKRISALSCQESPKGSRLPLPQILVRKPTSHSGPVASDGLIFKRAREKDGIAELFNV